MISLYYLCVSSFPHYLFSKHLFSHYMDVTVSQKPHVCVHLGERDKRYLSNAKEEAHTDYIHIVAMTTNGRQFIKKNYQVKHPDSFVLIRVGMQVHPGIHIV